VIKLKSNLLVTWAVAGTLGNTIHTINIAGGSPSFVPTAKIKGDVRAGKQMRNRSSKGAENKDDTAIQQGRKTKMTPGFEEIALRWRLTGDSDESDN